MKLRLALSLIAIAVLTRLTLNLLPAPPYNFSPIAAIGLFGAAAFSRKWLALGVPFAALFLSDLFLNNVIYSEYYSGFTLFTSGWIYAAFGMVVLLGLVFVRNSMKPGHIALASIAGSLIFFLVTNFSVWYGSTFYPQNPAGLLACYTAGIPFLGNTLMGDLFFNGVLFGAWFRVLNSRYATQKA
ncbi:MAG: hypothetical protein RJA20_2116 [Bacteroidota bacterium]|jgi:hypothetical protein